MPSIAGFIDWDGAIVAVRVGVSQNRRERLKSVGFTIPAEIPLRLQLDTGSHLTGFPRTVFKALEITPFDEIPISTPSTKPGEACKAFLFDVSLTLAAPDGHTRTFASVHAIASDDFNANVNSILGRNVLDECDFFWRGPDKTFYLEF
ncbi:MAG TPA: hypothetical protein VMS17_11335 [Gemmataceae bacterium]|nr:hypothetical protein [Gemmataceae bacterium]